LKILVIDDSRFQRAQLAWMLGELGHEVLEAPDGQEGLRLLEAQAPDLALCDLLMPVMDGREFLAQVQRSGLATPVLVLSADVQSSTREACRTLGARGFLTKPCSPEDLATAIRPFHPAELPRDLQP
jgi:CheY-like chemotaxis protein